MLSMVLQRYVCNGECIDCYAPVPRVHMGARVVLSCLGAHLEGGVTVRIHVRVCVCACVCMYVSVCVCVCIYICAYTCACECVCVCM